MMINTSAGAVGNVGIGARVAQATDAFGEAVEAFGEAVVVAVAAVTAAGSGRCSADQSPGRCRHGATGRSGAIAAGRRERHQIRHRTGRVVRCYGGARCGRAQHCHVLVDFHLPLLLFSV